MTLILVPPPVKIGTIENAQLRYSADRSETQPAADTPEIRFHRRASLGASPLPTTRNSACGMTARTRGQTAFKNQAAPSTLGRKNIDPTMRIRWLVAGLATGHSSTSGMFGRTVE
jgi:hypothetical protein